MKSLKNILTLIAAAGLGLGLYSCADLGIGVDADSNGINPYWYGGGTLGYGGPWYNTPQPLPIYGPSWGPGPVIDYNPTYRPDNRPNLPPQVNRPPLSQPDNTPSRPSVSLSPNGTVRPGNMGRPQPEAAPIQSGGGLNLNRGR